MPFGCCKASSSAVAERSSPPQQQRRNSAKSQPQPVAPSSASSQPAPNPFYLLPSVGAAEMLDALKPFVRLSELVPQLRTEVEQALYESQEISEESLTLCRRTLKKLMSSSLVSSRRGSSSVGATDEQDGQQGKGSGRPQAALFDAASRPWEGQSDAANVTSDSCARFLFGGKQSDSDLKANKEKYLGAVGALAMCLDCLLCSTVASLRAEAAIDQALPNVLPEEAAKLFDLQSDPELIQIGFRMLAVLGGAAAEQDEGLRDACLVTTLTEALWLLTNDVLRPSTGLHRVESVKREVHNLHHIFAEVGVQDKQLLSSPESFHAHLRHNVGYGLPLFTVGSAGKLSLIYLQSVFDGQKKLTLPHAILRHEVLRTAAKPVASFEHPTWKIFPTFERKGRGTEQGEGHGPRKEFFDSVAEEILSPYGPSLDMSDYARVSEVVGQRKLRMEWSSASALAAARLSSRSVIELVTKKKGHEADGPGGHPHTTYLLQVKDATQGTIVAAQDADAADSSSSSIVSNEVTLQSPCPLTNPSPSQSSSQASSHSEPTIEDIVGIKVKEVVTPLFVVPIGIPFAWINPTLAEKAPTPEALTQFEALGAIIANAPGNGVEFPAPIAPLFFKLAFNTTILSDVNLQDEAYSYPPTEEDLDLVFPGSRDELAKIRAMPKEEFTQLLELEGFEDPSSMTVESYIAQQAVASRILPGQTWQYLRVMLRQFRRCTLGFSRSLLRRDPLRHTVALYCGKVDDGVSDFRFKDVFSFKLGDEMTDFEHGKVLKNIFFTLIDEEFDAETKRQLLQFVTGRIYLPSRPKAERISIEFPATVMSMREFNRQYNLLPSSHSCDNVLELPNYLEAVLFRTQGLWYEATGEAQGQTINAGIKRKCWGQLSQSKKDAAREECARLMKQKLLLAISASAGYELDETTTNPPASSISNRPPSSGDRAGATRSNSQNDFYLEMKPFPRIGSRCTTPQQSPERDREVRGTISASPEAAVRTGSALKRSNSGRPPLSSSPSYRHATDDVKKGAYEAPLEPGAKPDEGSPEPGPSRSSSNHNLTNRSSTPIAMASGNSSPSPTPRTENRVSALNTSQGYAASIHSGASGESGSRPPTADQRPSSTKANATADLDALMTELNYQYKPH